MTLDQIIEQSVKQYRTIFLASALFVTCASFFFVPFYVWALILASNVGLYFVGLYILAWSLQRLIPQNVIDDGLRIDRIAEINRKLLSGELEPGSRELDTEMKAAGLEPLSIAVEYGPVFGKLGDAEMHEWIDGKKGLDGEIRRYFFVERASYGPTGLILVDSFATNEDQMVVDDFLYQTRSEPKNDSTDASN